MDGHFRIDRFASSAESSESWVCRSLGGPLRLELVHGQVGAGNLNVKMPGDQGWEPWVKLGCAAPRRHFARQLPPLPVTRTTFRLDANLVR